MSRIAQICSAIREQPWMLLGYLLGASYLFLIAIVAFGSGWAGILSGVIVVALLWSISILQHHRCSRFKLSEIGEIRMEIAAGPTGGFSRKMTFGLLIVISALYAIMVAAEGAVMIHANFFDGAWDEVPDLRSFGRQVLFGVVNVACIYSVYRNQWRRLLITDQGIFQVVDTKRPWPSDRPLDEPNSPLRVVRIYSWEQIARFHWSQQSGEHVLHLNVHHPGFGVPQLVSFSLRSLSEAGWQKLDKLLRAHLSGMSDQEPGRALTTSAAV